MAAETVDMFKFERYLEVLDRDVGRQICNDKIASMKRSNIKWHFDTRHATFASKYPAGDSRKKESRKPRATEQGASQQAETQRMDPAR